MSNNVPVLMLRGANGKFFPVAGITGGGGGTGGASTAANVSYINTQLPNVKNVKMALDELVTKLHTHATDTNITLADNTEYRFTDVTTLTLTYPTGNFECWMSLTFAASGTIMVTLPTDTKYLGSSPNFKNGETWEVDIKDGVMVAQKVGDGSIAPIETVEDGTEVNY